MIYEFLFGVLALIGFCLLGFGFWLLGQWLRKKGHGEQLDRIDVRITKSQNVIRRFFINPVKNSVASTLLKTPVLGKHYKSVFKDTDKQKDK